MAVEDKYVNAQGLTDEDQAYASYMRPGTYGHQTNNIAVAAADDDGSVYRFAKAVPASTVILQCLVENDAITLGTDYDIGIYKTDLGAVVDKDIIADGVDLSSASTVPVERYTAPAIELKYRPLYELAGHTEDTKLASYDLAVTANTVGSAAGDIRVHLVTQPLS